VKARAVSIEGLLLAARSKLKQNYLEVNMTAATDTDIREIKTAIESNTKAIEAIAKGTEANTLAIATLAAEMRLGFSNIDTKFAEVRGDIKILDSKFEERTKGFSQRLDGKELAQRNISTGLTVAIVGGLLLTLAKYLFFGSNP
jgi:hypothetical protein